MKTIYIAGPISKGDLMVNARAAFEAADACVVLGLHPFVPHALFPWHLHSPKDYEWWMEYDRVWLEKCDALLRIPGESPGADREILTACTAGLPVFYDVGSVRDWVQQCHAVRL